MRADRFKTSLVATICAAAFVGSAIGQLTAQQPPAGAAPGQNPAAGRGGGAAASGVFTVSDINKDGAVTRGELMTTLEKWFIDSDAAKSGTITQDQLLTALNAALPQPPPPAAGRGRGQNCGGATQTPCPDHVTAMTAALPATAPAKPARARKVLVLAKADGFVHSSIPLAAATVEALGTKTKAWSTTISYDPADINEANLKQYDAVFLDSTTGCFLDDRADAAMTTARRAALLAFVRGGKGLGGIHAATDSYHQSCAGGRGRGAAPAQAAPGAAPGAVTTQAAAAPPAPRAGGAGRGGGAGAQLAAQIVTLADKNTDQQLSLTEMNTLANELFDKLDTEKVGRVSQADFTARFDGALPQPARGGRGAGGAAPGAAGAAAPAQDGGRGAVRDWPEFNTMIGGMFLAHPFQHVWVKVDDPKSPITAPFKGQTFEITDETYTMQREVFSRENMHVLLSIDVDRMTPEDKARENRPWDHDYALSWIRREGRGRVFYSAHGHNEAIYAMKPMLEHYLAGIQYILGDLKADDTPSVKPGAKK